MSHLDRNLELLLGRAYVAAAPRPAFREALRARWLREAPRSRSPSIARRALPWAAAAAVLVAGLLGLRLLLGSSEDAAAILTRGQVAWRAGASEDWTAITPASAGAGLELPAEELAVLTPPGVVARLRPPEGELLLAGDAELAARREGERLELTLARGALVLARPAEAPPWRVLLGTGTVESAVGEVALTRRPFDALVEVVAGRAVLVSGGETAELATGESALLTGRGVRRLGETAAVLPGELPRPPAPGAEPLSLPVAADEPVAAIAEAPAAEGMATLRGRVTDARSGAPVGAFEIVLLVDEGYPATTPPRREAFTAADGGFAIAELSAGSYELFAHAPGYAVRHVHPVEVAAAAAPVDVSLDGGGRIAGRVVDRATGEPLAGALVVSETDSMLRHLPASLVDLEEIAPAELLPARALTGVDGRFELESLSSGQQMLRALAAGHAATWSDQIELAPGGFIDDVLLEMQVESRIEGRVLRDDDQPWRDAQIIAACVDFEGSRQRFLVALSVTDAEGAYSLGGLPEGEYMVMVEPSDVGMSAMHQSSLATVPEAGRLVLNFPLLREGFRLSGRVLDVEGRPLPGFAVSIAPAGSESAEDWQGTMTDALGAFAFDGLPADVYGVCVGRGIGNATLVDELPVGAGAGDVTHDLVLRGGRLGGRLTDAVTGRPLPFAVVIVLRLAEDDGREFAARLFTQGDGSFVSEGLTDGRYVVLGIATRGAYAYETAGPLLVEHGVDVLGMEVALGPGSTLTVRVVDGAGAPVERAGVRFEDERGNEMQFNATTFTDAAGLYHAAGLKPGRWTVSAAKDGAGPVHQELDVEAGQALDVTLTLERSPP